MVRVYWQPRLPIWQQFGSDPDPNPKWRSGTIAYTNRNTAVMEMDGATGSIYSGDPGVDRSQLASHRILDLVSHLLSISYRLIIQRIIHSIFRIFWSHSLFPRLRVDPHSRVVSYLLTLFLPSSSQNRSFSRIPFGLPWEVRRSVDDELSAF